MQDLKETAKNIRKQILEMMYKTKSPHIGGCFSCVEILTALYFKVLNVDPARKTDKERDMFILSKGHAGPALYAVLAERGFFDKDILEKFAVNGGILEYHPTKNIEMGIELTTGSLGHGISVGCGLAKARKMDNSKSRVFVFSSDGDMEEGAVWPGLMFASKHKLDNLIVIVDYNKMQAIDRTEDVLKLDSLPEKFKSFGWEAKEVNGHDFEEIFNALKDIPFTAGKPSVVIANTIKGKGVSFMENDIFWHSKYPNEEEYKKALKEL